MLLPNLTRIQCESYYPAGKRIVNTLLRISRQEKPTVSKRLRKVNVKFRQFDDEPEHSEFNIIRHFSKIASVDTLSGHLVGGFQEDLLYIEPPMPFSSNITNLSLAKCDVNSRVLSDFLLTLDRLQYFTYSSGGLNTELNPFEPF